MTAAKSSVSSSTDLARTFLPMRLLGLAAADHASCVPAAVLAADLSNFTGLTEALSRRAGIDGGERVARELNQALGPAVDILIRHGGDVVKFAGDGLLCVFPGDARIAIAAEHAAREIAGLAVQGPDGERHHFRLAMTHGPVALTIIGETRRRELVAGGAAVERAQRLLGTSAPATPGAVERLPLPATATLLPAVPVDDVESYLPLYVRERLTDELAAWLAEARTLTIVFAAIEAGADVAVLQRRALQCQSVLDGHAGQLLRFGLEGPTLVAEMAFGLAVGARTAGSAEALQCASALARSFDDCRVGVSTGRVLLGPVGSLARRQLTSLGSAVNLSARLMQQADAGQVLVDEVTWGAAGPGRLAGERLSGPLKGLGERTYFRLRSTSEPTPARDAPLFGRAAERRAVIEVLSEQASSTRPILLWGEAGIGKSRFARWLADELRARGVSVLSARCTPVGRDTPYSSLAPAIAALCGLQPGADDTGQLDALAARLFGDVGRAALLRDALGRGQEGVAAGADLSGHVRADNIRETLLALFRDFGSRTGMALVVEDAHWLDSTSWLLLQRLAVEADGVRLVIVTRPMTRLEATPLQAIRAHGTLVLDLAPLSEQAIVAVVSHRLRVREVPPELARWITERVRGNPFFAEELAAMVATLSELETRDGVLVRPPTVAELEALPMASTIESTIEQRIDCLGADDAVLLKIASVIGPSFDLDELIDVSQRSNAESIAAAVARLVAADMAAVEDAGRFAFRHRYTQKAAYGMLPGERRRELHARVAGGMESRLADRAEDRAGILAHHWYEAEHWPKAAHWLERAGSRALSTGADREAATHFERALSLKTESTPGRRAAWHRQLAQALFGLGRVEGVEAEARKAFELVARRLPLHPLGWTGLALATTTRRVLGGLLPGRSVAARQRDADARRDELEGARAAALLAESAYFVNAPEMMLASALLAVDMSERAALPAPVSTAYGMLAVVLGMARMRATATRYLHRARTIAEEAGDPYQQGVAWFYAAIYHGCLGDWSASLDASRRALAITDALGAYMLSGRLLTIVATNALYTSEYAKTRAWMETMRSRAERLANVQQVGWSGNVVSVADLHQGRYGQAIENAERARDIFLVEHDRISLTISEGVRCAALCRSGRMDEALEAADGASRWLAGARPTTWGQLEGFAGPCEVYATALEQGSMTYEAMQPRLRVALWALRMFAIVFPFGRARYHWTCGRLAHARGWPGAARRHHQRAIAVARRFRMGYEEMRATELLAPLLAPEEQARLLAEAQALRIRLQTAAAVHPEVQSV